MQAITTKVIPATATKPTRVKAQSASGISVTISADQMSGDDSHAAAVHALCRKLEWHGRLAIGGLNNHGDKVYVFVTGDTAFDV